MATPQERKFAFSYVERGKQFVAAKQYPEALEALREAVRRDPTLVEAWILLASVHYTLGEGIECLGATEEALKHRANSGAAWNFRGLTLARLNRDEEALDAFARTMRIEGWFVTGAQNAFEILIELRRFDEALQVANVLLAEQQSNGTAWTMRSAALRNLRRYEQAYHAANEALQLDGENRQAWYELAAALTQMKRYDEALEASERESMLQGSSLPDSLWLRAIILDGQRRFDEALAVCWQAQSLDPTSADIANLTGIVLLHLGRPAEACKQFLHAMTLNFDEPIYLGNMGAALSHLRRFDDALTWNDRALALQGGYSIAAINRADVLLHLKRLEEAEAQLTHALRIAGDHSGYWTVKGALHTYRGEYDEALVAIKRAIDRSEDDSYSAFAYEHMGELLIALEDYAKALEFAEHGLELRPYDFYLQELKAKALRRLGRETEAAEIERFVKVRLAEQLALLDQAEGANG
jgi:superkiller protein 3